jgi:hypothetical protein
VAVVRVLIKYRVHPPRLAGYSDAAGTLRAEL